MSAYGLGANQEAHEFYQKICQMCKGADVPMPLSYSQIITSNFVDFDLDLFNLRRNIEAMTGNDLIKQESLELVDRFSALIQALRQNFESEALKRERLDPLNRAAYDTKRKSFWYSLKKAWLNFYLYAWQDRTQEIAALKSALKNRVAPDVYRLIDRLQKKLETHIFFMEHDVAALTVPRRGPWREINVWMQAVCAANNIPTPTLYYGKSLDDIGAIITNVAPEKLSGSGTIEHALSPIIFIDELYIRDCQCKSATVEEWVAVIKGTIAHELGHLYYGDVPSSQTFREYLVADPRFEKFRGKYFHYKEYRADLFAARYGLGNALADYFKKCGDRANKTHPSAENRVQKLAQAMTIEKRSQNLFVTKPVQPGTLNVTSKTAFQNLAKKAAFALRTIRK